MTKDLKNSNVSASESGEFKFDGPRLVSKGSLPKRVREMFSVLVKTEFLATKKYPQAPQAREAIQASVFMSEKIV